jgi:HEPN domain-containing protein
MKTRADLVRGWLRKSQSDLDSTGLCLASGKALDVACFHAQQAAEKCLKAFLVARGIEFPFVHNIEKLVELCAREEPAFSALKTIGQSLTPFAVELRYDEEFWPAIETAREAFDAAVTIRQLVVDRLPADAGA